MTTQDNIFKVSKPDMVQIQKLYREILQINFLKKQQVNGQKNDEQVIHKRGKPNDKQIKKCCYSFNYKYKIKTIISYDFIPTELQVG